MKKRNSLILTLIFALLFIISNDKIYSTNLTRAVFGNEVKYTVEDKKDENKVYIKEDNNNYYKLRNEKKIKIEKLIFKFFIFSYKKIDGRNDLKYLE